VTYLNKVRVKGHKEYLGFSSRGCVYGSHISLPAVRQLLFKQPIRLGLMTKANLKFFHVIPRGGHPLIGCWVLSKIHWTNFLGVWGPRKSRYICRTWYPRPSGRCSPLACGHIQCIYVYILVSVYSCGLFGLISIWTLSGMLYPFSPSPSWPATITNVHITILPDPCQIVDIWYMISNTETLCVMLDHFYISWKWI
jgi:hypothetical protein